MRKHHRIVSGKFAKTIYPRPHLWDGLNHDRRHLRSSVTIKSARVQPRKERGGMYIGGAGLILLIILLIILL